MDAGSQAVLLPMPMFFRYQQEDIRAYAALTSRAIDAPCLLYDLPDFTNGLAPETSVSLMEEEPQIAGIKDSSGRYERLSIFADARSRANAGGKNLTLLVGDDKLLRAGLEAGWDGAISGVAGCCPELLVALVKNFNEGKTDEVTRLQARLDELIARLSVFPTPWGIRIALQARGIETGPLPLPVTPGRRSQIEAFQSWFTRWIE
jgi:4-hydroxy-tetrahydrodipicolinate synthase